VEELLQAEFARAKQLVRDNRDFVARIADELNARGNVTAEQVVEMAEQLNVSASISAFD